LTLEKDVGNRGSSWGATKIRGHATKCRRGRGRAHQLAVGAKGNNSVGKNPLSRGRFSRKDAAIPELARGGGTVHCPKHTIRKKDGGEPQ